MKYIIILYIALGCVLSLIVGIEYSCNGQEMFPEYYASPFVFKQKSLGSSLTYYYSVSGLLLNIALWSMFVLLFHMLIQKQIERKENNTSLKKIYRGVVITLIVFTTLHVAIDYIMLGSGFEEGSNYWYMDLDKEAKIWGVDCEGKWVMFATY